MSIVLGLPFVLVGLAAAALVAVAVAIAAGPRPAAGEHAHLVAYARRARGWRAAALALATVTCVAVPVLGLGGGDTAPAIAPALAGVIVIGVIGLGEITFRRPETVVRSADLRPRRLGDLMPTGWLVTATAALLALAAALLVGVVNGSPDDLGRTGRAITVICDNVTHTRTPWPGSHYAVPIALATCLSALLAIAVCAAIAGRPSPAAESSELDAGLRRWSVAGVLQALTLVACVTLVPVLTLIATGSAASACAPGPYQLQAICSGVGAAVATIVGVVAFVALCTGPRVRPGGVQPHHPPPTPIGTPR